MGVGIFTAQKYNDASQKALEFIIDQMRTKPAK